MVRVPRCPLAWVLFSSTNQFTVNLEGCLACTKFWGSTGPYMPVPMFGEAGGEG